MTWTTQRNAERGIEETLLGTLATHKFLPEYFEGNGVMVRVKVYGFALTAVCATLLTGKIIAQVYRIAPSDVWLGLSQYFLLFGFAVSPVVGLFANSLLRSFGLSDQEFSCFEVMKREVLGYAKRFAVHVEFDRNDSAAATLAKVLALILDYPKVNASIICAAMISGIGTILRPCHVVTQYIRFNRGLLANRVNCGNPDRREPRAIRSQAIRTRVEGSETTGAVESA
jgi:hypothetical protein